ncbi:hypothetical protein SLEP1_g56035 [Rubroshorea leprosula]|uniref:Uncharacterized protein n=1 Tax=Rubroshorea leprosula TaxID=152421 RepID=A0AAV5MIE8_9ROSI|nr:hypothetical protein SLEP1_g56035 [Rubroshorea leprosula]
MATITLVPSPPTFTISLLPSADLRRPPSPLFLHLQPSPSPFSLL